jgi:chemotaxis protein MotB
VTTKPTIFVIKKKGGHGGHHGGAWKVAYADFVTAMMSLFIVLWLLNTSKAVREAVAGYFHDPAGTANKVGSNIAGSGEKILLSHDNMGQLKEKLEKVLKQMPNFDKLKKHITMTITGEGLRIELTESEKGTFFDSGSPNLNADGQEIVKVLSGELGTLPNKLALEGHTDSTPYAAGRNYGNWELSSDRANSTRRLMQQNGIGADQITQVRGFADQRLLKPDAPLDPANRRISLIVLYQQEAASAVSASAADSPATPTNAADAKTGDAASPDSNAKAVAPAETKPASAPSAKIDGAKTTPAPKQPAGSTLSLEEIRNAVEKMNGKTPAPATSTPATTAEKPDKKSSDKPKDKPQN